MPISWSSKNPLRRILIVVVSALLLSFFPSETAVAQSQSKGKKAKCVITQQVLTSYITTFDKITYIRGIFEVENRAKQPQVVRLKVRFQDPITRKVIYESSGNEYQYVGIRQKVILNVYAGKAPSDFSGSIQAMVSPSCEPRNNVQVLTAEGNWDVVMYDGPGWIFSFKNDTRLTVTKSERITVSLYDKETGKLVFGCDTYFPPSAIPPGYGFEVTAPFGGCTGNYRPFLPKEESQYQAVARVAATKS